MERETKERGPTQCWHCMASFVHRDERLNREEWAVAMHLAVCVGAKKLPLPARLPKCLQRRVSSKQQQPLKEPGQRRQQQGESVAAGEKAGKGKGDEEPFVKQEETATKISAAPVDLKRATKEFKNGDMEAKQFLPVLQVGMSVPGLFIGGGGAFELVRYSSRFGLGVAADLLVVLEPRC